MISAVVNKSWKQHPTNEQLFSYLPLISKTIRVTSWETKTKSSATYFYAPQHMDVPVLADCWRLIYISSVRTLDVVWRTWWDQWMIGTGIEKEEAGKIVPSAWLDNDDDDDDDDDDASPKEGYRKQRHSEFWKSHLRNSIIAKIHTRKKKSYFESIFSVFSM